MESLETTLDHGYPGFWQEWFELPVVDLIRHEQRYVDFMTEYDLRFADQCVLVAKLDAGAAL